MIPASWAWPMPRQRLEWSPHRWIGSGETTARAVLLLGMAYWACLLAGLDYLGRSIETADLGVRLTVPAAAWGLAVVVSAVSAGLLVRVARSSFLIGVVLTSAGLNALLLVIQAFRGQAWPADGTIRFGIDAVSVALLALPVRVTWAVSLTVASVLVAVGSARQVMCVYEPACPTQPGFEGRPPVLVSEGYFGYNIVRQNGRLYAVRQGDGPFDLSRFQRGAYLGGAQGNSLRDVELRVAAGFMASRVDTSNPAPQLILEGFEGYNVVFAAGRYVGLPQASGTFDPALYRRGTYSGAVEAAEPLDLLHALPVAQARRPPAGEYTLRDGFYPPEGGPGQPLPRWTTGNAHVFFSPLPDQDISVTMRIVQPQLGQLGVPALVMVLDGETVPESWWRVERRDPGRYDISLTLPALAGGSGVARHLAVTAPTFVPARTDSSSRDERTLGVRIESFSIRGGGQTLRLLDLPVKTAALSTEVQ